MVVGHYHELFYAIYVSTRDHVTGRPRCRAGSGYLLYRACSRAPEGAHEGDEIGKSIVLYVTRVEEGERG
jgi:hypothetical protein